MNEDRVTEVTQTIESKMQRFEDLIRTKFAKEKSISSNDAAAATDDYVEHSFGGVPIPKAPGRLGDLSGMIVADHDDADNILLGS